MNKQINNKKISLVGIRLKSSGKIRNYKTAFLNLRVGDKCIVEIERGEELGIVVIAPRKQLVNRNRLRNLKRILRKANPQDLKRIKKNLELEREAYLVCADKIGTKKLMMKLVKVDFSFDARKAVFSYTAEERVDFRELIKELAEHFRTKIEMRQIGMREKAKLLGNYGCCGRVLCCSSYLKDFVPVSIRMAKDQNLALNPFKISGLCGRLMCCLVYENEFYVRQKKKMPRCGKKMETREGKGKIIQCDLLTESLLIELEEGEKVKIKMDDDYILKK